MGATVTGDNHTTLLGPLPVSRECRRGVTPVHLARDVPLVWEFQTGQWAMGIAAAALALGTTSAIAYTTLPGQWEWVSPPLLWLWVSPPQALHYDTWAVGMGITAAAM